MKSGAIGSGDVMRLLRGKHSGDVFYEEVAIGGMGGKRLDAVAIGRSWSPVCVIGYEIKVSRGDFMRDDKWQGYLDQCHQLYFVVPKGLLRPGEVISDQVGLMEVVGGKSLVTRRKAPFRTIPNPWKLVHSILVNRMDRVDVGTERRIAALKLFAGEDDPERAMERLGDAVSYKTAEMVRRLRWQAEGRQSPDSDRLERLAKAIAEEGLPDDPYALRVALRSLRSGQDMGSLLYHLRAVVGQLEEHERRRSLPDPEAPVAGGPR